MVQVDAYVPVADTERLWNQSPNEVESAVHPDVPASTLKSPEQAPTMYSFAAVVVILPELSAVPDAPVPGTC
jgi:hypothetical protein